MFDEEPSHIDALRAILGDPVQQEASRLLEIRESHVHVDVLVEFFDFLIGLAHSVWRNAKAAQAEYLLDERIVQEAFVYWIDFFDAKHFGKSVVNEAYLLGFFFLVNKN